MPRLVPIEDEQPKKRTSRLVPITESSSKPTSSRLVPINGADLDDLTFVPGDTDKGYNQWKQWRQGKESSEFGLTEAAGILKQMVGEFAGGMSQAAKLAAAGEGKRLVNSVAEGVLRGSADLGLVVQKAADKGRRALTVDEEEALSRDEFRRWRSIRKLEAMRERARSGEEDLVDFLSLTDNLATDDVDVDPEVAEAASYLTDISTVAAPPVAAAVKASKVGPKVAAMGSKAASGVGKAARVLPEKAAEKFPRITKIAKSVPAVAGTVAGASKGSFVESAVGGAIGAAAVPATKKALEKVKKLEPFGSALTKSIEDLPAAPSNMGVAERIAKNPAIPEKIRSTASSLSLADPLFRGAGDIARVGASGSALGAGLGAVSGEGKEDIFAGAVGGGLSGTAGGAINKTFKALSGRQRAEYMQGSVQDFLNNHKGNNDALLSFSPSDLNNAATAYEILKGKVDIQVLDSKSYANTAGGQAQRGSSANYDPKTKTITVDGQKKGAGQSLLHEVGEALWDSGIVDKPTIGYEIKNLYGDLTPFRESYAKRLLIGEQSGRAVKQPTSKEIDAKIRELDGGSEPDWVVREIFSEGLMAETYGKDLREYISGPLSKPLIEARASIMDVISRLTGKKGIDSLGYADNIFDGKLVKDQKMSKAYQKYVRDLNRHYNETLARDSYLTLPKKKHHPATGITDGQSDLFNLKDGKITSKKESEINRVFNARAKDVKATIPEGILGDEDPRVGQKYVFNNDGSINSNRTEIRGTVLPEKILSLESMQALRGRAEVLQKAIGEGQILRSWYQGVGTGSSWVRSVIRNKGNLPARHKRFLPIGWLITKNGNVNVKAIDLDYAAARSKRWLEQGKLKLWGNDVDSFLSDAKRLLKNHVDGVPGKTGFSDEKFNIVNAFFQGHNKSINPAYTAWDSDSGRRIYEDLRLERIASIDTASPDGTPFGMGPFSHTKIKRMMSPKREDAKPVQLQPEFKKQRDLNNRGGAIYTSPSGHKAIQTSNRAGVRVYNKKGTQVGPVFKSLPEAQKWLEKN